MNRTRSLLVVVVVVGMLAAACRGDDSSDATASDEPDTTSEAPDTGSETTAEAEGSSTTEATPTSEEPQGVMFGDLASPCGPGDAAGATDQGVTDDAILIGTMSDATATAQPGLNQELWDASRAFVEWCNEQGGINGRPIEYTEYESKLFEAQQRTIEACDREFMLVGGGAAFDDQVAPEREKCGLPDVPAYNATRPATEAALSYPPMPTPFDALPSGEAFYLADQYPDSVAKAGMLAPNFASAIDISTRAQTAYEGAGWEFVSQQLYNPAGEANWTGIVSSLRSDGTDALVYVGTYEPLAAFLQAAAEQEWKPTILIGSSTILNNDFVTEAGDAAAGAMSYTTVVPFAEAEEGNATAAYLGLLDEYAGGAAPGDLGAKSVSAWLLWATAASACGSELTRDCIAEQIGEIHDWTAGGLHAPSDPGAGQSPPCFVLLEVTDGVWTRNHPGQGFDCDPSYVVPTAGAFE